MNAGGGKLLQIFWPSVAGSGFVCPYAGSLFKVCQQLYRIVVCRVKSGQTTIQLHQRRARVDSVRHRLGLGHRSAGPLSLLDAWSRSTIPRYSTVMSRDKFTLRYWRPVPLAKFFCWDTVSQAPPQLSPPVVRFDGWKRVCRVVWTRDLF